MWFGKKKKNYLGVDIGASAVKLVELEQDENRYLLKNYGVYPLEIYARQPGLELTKLVNEEIAEILRKVIKEAEVEAKESFFSIPVYSSFSTLIDFPGMPEKEIAAAVSFEAKKYVPVPLSDVILDWAVVSPLDNKSANVQILLVAVLKETVDDLSQIARLAGLRLNSLEVETFGLVRSLVGNDKSGILLVDTGARSSNISIIDEGSIRVIYNFEVGGLKLTQSIARFKKIPYEAAEKMKLESLFDQQGNLAAEVLKPFLDSIVEKAKTIIDGYQDKYKRKLEKCVLVGGSAQIPGVLDYFSKNINLEVSSGHPFARVVYPPELGPVLLELAPTLAVAVGLAMK